MRSATPLHEAWRGVDERHAPLWRAWRGDRHQDLVDLGSPNSKEPGRLRIASFALCITQHANGEVEEEMSARWTGKAAIGLGTPSALRAEPFCKAQKTTFDQLAVPIVAKCPDGSHALLHVMAGSVKVAKLAIALSYVEVQ